MVILEGSYGVCYLFEWRVGTAKSTDKIGNFKKSEKMRKKKKKN